MRYTVTIKLQAPLDNEPRDLPYAKEVSAIGAANAIVQVLDQFEGERNLPESIDPKLLSITVQVVTCECGCVEGDYPCELGTAGDGC